MKVKPDGAIGPFQLLSQVQEALDLRRAESYNLDLDYEVHTDKPPYKIVPCTICRRTMVVNTFYVLAWAKCDGSGCSGNTKERGSVGVAQAGRTDPATAANLSECLINEGFKQAICPAHPDDPDHVMELKSVAHSDHYGPGEWRLIGGTRVWTQLDKGETAMWQCTHHSCKAIVTYSTTAQSHFKRVNEPKQGGNTNGWGDLLGRRVEEPPEEVPDGAE